MWTPPEKIKHALPAAHWPTALEAARARWFQPVQIGTLRARDRTWVPAMVPWRASPTGEVTREVLDWYARFAAGRPAVLVVEATGIRDVPSGPLLRIGDDRFLPGLRRLVEVVKEASGGQTLVFIQLIDFLAIRRRPSREQFLERFLQLGPSHRARLAALLRDEIWLAAEDTAVRARLHALEDGALREVLGDRDWEALMYGSRERVTDLHLPHIRDLPRVLPELFAGASARAAAAGFDGVELHFAHAYTMASFLSAKNDRNDGYGGSLAGRVKLPLEVLRSVRARVGSRYVVGARMLVDEVIEGGSRVEDTGFFAVELARAGLDFLSLSKGGKFEDAAQPKMGEAAYPYTGPSGYECMPTVYSDARGPFSRNVDLMAQVKRRLLHADLHLPVVVAGGVATFEEGDRLLERGDADLVAAARQSLADPDWWEKMRSGRGAEIRRCHFTNYCEALDQRHLPVTCKLWDREALDEPDIPLDATGRRRLVAPNWKRSTE
jgi:2,4-dienoyl-CoA reductase-like NADH-dependent reductase (Old Yellow Enzyme family)